MNIIQLLILFYEIHVRFESKAMFDTTRVDDKRC